MRLQGANLLTLQLHGDARGELGVIECGSQLGFEIKRVFYIRNASRGAIRAEHAVSATQAIVAISGGATIDLDNGDETESIVLADPMTGLRIEAGVWLRIRDLLPGTVLLVVASKIFAETEYFERPCAALTRSG